MGCISEISSYLFDGRRARAATSQVLVSLAVCAPAATSGDYSEYIITDQYSKWQSDALKWDSAARRPSEPVWVS